MSNLPETDLDLDLHFLPAWAQKPADQNRYANYAGESASGQNRRQDRGPSRPPPQRARSGPSRQPDRGPSSRRPDDRRRPEARPRREEAAPAPLPDLNVAFRPDDKGVDSLARQIKMTGRAYPLFDIAQMVLQKPERQSLTISVEKKPDGQIIQPLFVCALDETLWLSEAEAVQYVLDKHFTTFYQSERTQIEAPKGTYTFVAQCGMSGVILGPPNYHDYQNQLRKLHAERFFRMPFEGFKARVKIVRDEAVVKKWIEDQSWKTEYLCLNLPEPLKLGSRSEVETHFRATHLPNIIRQVESFTISGIAARTLRSTGLARLVRQAWEDQRRFPLQIATVLSQQFAAHGLQFFKVNRTVTHVAVARPHYLDLEAEPVSEGVRRIVQFINATPKCTRRRVVEALAPSRIPVLPAEGSAPVAPATEPAEPTPEANAVSADLHWLIHQGHVIEFANGMLETAKKPLLKPAKPAAPLKPPAEASKEGSASPQTIGEIPAAEPSANSEPVSRAAEAAPMNISSNLPVPGEPISALATEGAPQTNVAPDNVCSPESNAIVP